MVAGPPASRSTIPRRIGWARALKGSLAITLTIPAGLRSRRTLAGHPALGEDLDADFALSNVMVYWLTGTAAAAARLYYENAHASPPTDPTTIPIALAAFAGGFSGMRRFAERDHKNIVHWSTFEQAGHFAGP
jgi:hypothetical protein